MKHDQDRKGRIRLMQGIGRAPRCVACGLCVSHCPVQCISMDWKKQAPQASMDPMDAPVTVHLGQPVLAAPPQDPPPAALFGTLPRDDPRGATLHLGTPIPVSRDVPVPNRQRRQPTVFFVDHEKCIRCGVCVDICPVRALEFDQGPVGEDLLQDLQNRELPEKMEQNKGAHP